MKTRKKDTKEKSQRLLVEDVIDVRVLTSTIYVKEENRTCSTFWVCISSQAGTREAVDVICTTCAVEAW